MLLMAVADLSFANLGAFVILIIVSEILERFTEPRFSTINSFLAVEFIQFEFDQ